MPPRARRSVYRRRHEHSSNPRGFVAYYCPKGVSPATPVTTDAGAAVNLDNTAYERLFATQNPPYVDTWYREADLSAATAQ